MTNRVHTWGDKISKAKKGMKFSDAHKNELSKAAKRRDNTNIIEAARKRTKNTKWYHDPITGKACQYKENSQPEGWLLGKKVRN